RPGHEPDADEVDDRLVAPALPAGARFAEPLGEKLRVLARQPDDRRPAETDEPEREDPALDPPRAAAEPKEQRRPDETVDRGARPAERRHATSSPAPPSTRPRRCSARWGPWR